MIGFNPRPARVMDGLTWWVIAATVIMLLAQMVRVGWIPAGWRP